MSEKIGAVTARPGSRLRGANRPISQYNCYRREEVQDQNPHTAPTEPAIHPSSMRYLDSYPMRSQRSHYLAGHESQPHRRRLPMLPMIRWFEGPGCSHGLPRLQHNHFPGEHRRAQMYIPPSFQWSRLPSVPHRFAHQSQWRYNWQVGGRFSDSAPVWNSLPNRQSNRCSGVRDYGRRRRIPR